MAECPVTMSHDQLVLPQPNASFDTVTNNIDSDLCDWRLSSDTARTDETHEQLECHLHQPKHSALDNFLRLGLLPVTPVVVDIADTASENAITVDHHHVRVASALHPSSSPLFVAEPEKVLESGDVLPPAVSPSMPAMLKVDITHVIDGLYLSDFASLSAARLRKLGVTFVVNATREIPLVDDVDSSVEFLKLDIDDIKTENIGRYFDVCADRIHGIRTGGGVALVHCALGISRSVSICLAYLVKYERRTLREAYFEVKKKRPIIRPNDGFWRQLITFEVEKRGRATVKLNIYPMGVIPDVYRGAPRTAATRNDPHFR